jgi:hypothetical protein
MWAEIYEDKWKMQEEPIFEEEWDGKKDWTKNPYTDRNYGFFELLAGVRSRGDVEPICEPKGIPKDASHGYLHHVEDWDCDGHSHSYFTLKELLDYGKTNVDRVDEALELTINNLKELDEEDPEKIRIVFFFDN